MAFRKEQKMKFRKGFTLIELLIVILILAALAAIAIPRITQSADTAKKNACATNIELLNSQIELYTADPNGGIGTLPALLTTVTGNVKYFPDGAPVCPYGTAYVMDGTTHHITAHSH